jgi:cytochrome c oxidase subunit 2
MNVLLALFSFSRHQSPLNPVGIQARHIEHNLVLIFAITSVVYLIVIAVLFFGVFRNHAREGFVPHTLVEDPDVDRKAMYIVSGAIGVTVVLLFVMMIFSFITSHRTAVLANAQSLKIDVYGHQWWWEVEYPMEEQPSRMVRTANEIHVPVGSVVTVHATSRDVIHSFWAPNIHGKKDLIPGYENDLTLEVDKPGTWRGQCAEFCGLQHAHMAFDIVAQSREDFDRWYVQQLSAAPDPATQQTIHGREVFLTHPCAMCHTIRGTTAGSNVGPDLTHLASRSMIAAGTLKNTPGNLAGWILNAQSIKPGVRMPPNPMSGQDLNDLLAYLETLR